MECSGSAYGFSQVLFVLWDFLQKAQIWSETLAAMASLKQKKPDYEVSWPGFHFQ